MGSRRACWRIKRTDVRLIIAIQVSWVERRASDWSGGGVRQWGLQLRDRFDRIRRQRI